MHYRQMRCRTVPLFVSLGYLAFFLIAPATTDAAVEYSNFGASDTYNSTFEPITGATTGRTYQSQADEFTAAFTGTITSVDIAAFGVSSDDVILRLYTNDPLTNLPLVSSRITLGDVAIAASPGGIATLTLGTSVTLTGGNQYWLEMAPGNAITTVDWYSASNVLANPSALSTDASQSFTSDPVADVFRVNASAVPEPQTWSFLALGVGLWICGSVARRYSACR